MENRFKNKIVLVMIIGMLILSGCYPANVDKTKTSDINDTNSTIADVKTDIDQLDEKTDHVTIKLTDKLIIDADVTEYDKYGGKKFGLYYIDYCNFVKNKEFYDYAKEKYGADVIITPEEANAAYAKDKNTTVQSNIYADENHLRLTKKRLPLEGSMDFFSLLCPLWEKNIDMNVVGAALDETYEVLGRLADISQYGLKRWIHTDAAYYVKAGALGVPDGYDSKEYYAVRHVQTCEGIPIVTDSNHHFHEVSEGYMIYLDNYTDVYIDSRGSLMGYNYSKVFDMEAEAFEYIDVISVKEVIKGIFAKYKNTFSKMKFYDIELVYSGDLKKDDAGGVKKFIRPYWIARYSGSVDNSSNALRYLVIDGQSGNIVYNY